MFDFNVVDEDEISEYLIKKIGQPTFFWKLVADPQDPIRVTLDHNEAKLFHDKAEANTFLKDNMLDEKGFEVIELD